VFVVFSGLGGLATDGLILIIARFVTGVAAGFLSPAGLSIITTSFPEGPARNRALLVYAGTAAAGFSLGVVAGGLLTEISWRWIFFAPVILSSGLFLAAVRLIPHSPPAQRISGSFDLAGAISLTAAMLLLVFTVVEAPAAGWSSARTVASFVASGAILAAFVTIERRSTAPLVRLGILRSAPLARSNFGAMCLIGAFVGFQFIAVLYMQQLRGWSALATGLALLPVSIVAVLAPTLTPRLVRRFGVTRVITAGLGLLVIGLALFLSIDLDSTYVAAMLPTMILIGLAFALAYGPLTIAATNGIAPDEQGLAGGLVYTSTQFGAALGLAVVTAVLSAATGAGNSPRSQLDGFHAALTVPLVIAIAGMAVVATAAFGRVTPVTETSDQTRL
jgi:MFS family permease